MSKIVTVVTVAVALSVVGAAVAASATSIRTYRAVMAPGAERPKPKAPASARGALTATVSDTGTTRTLTWKITFSGLSGRAVGAHVHKGRAGVAGAVLIPLCGPCRSGQAGQVKISKDAADALERGLAYVNVHTGKNPAGEVRGQVKLLGEDNSSSAPPPATTTPVAGGGSDIPGY